MADVSKGHNGGPPIQKLTAKNKVERIKEVLDMDISAAQKCVGIRIIADADTDGITPELSTEDLKRAASVRDRETVYRATRKLDEKKVAKPVKEEGRPNRYLVLPSEAIDAALDDIDATSRVEPDHPTPVKPDGSQDVAPVGLNPTTPSGSTVPVGSDRTTTTQVKPDQSAQTGRDDAAPRARDITTHANKESPSEILTTEELARRIASSLRSEVSDQHEAGELAGLNGSAELMVADIQQWLEPPATTANARQWLANTVRTFGQDVTAQSYHKLKTDMLTGGIVAKPLQAWAKIAQRLKAEQQKAADPPPPPQKPSRRAHFAKLVEEAAAEQKKAKTGVRDYGQ